MSSERLASSEPRIEELRARFQATFDSAAVGIAHLSIDGIWLRVNDRLCELTGYTREELIGRSFRDITHPDDIAADLAHLDNLRAGGIHSFTLEKRYVRKDRAVLWIERTVSLVRGWGDEAPYFLSVVQDIQQRKEAQAAVEELTRDLERRIADRTAELEARARDAERRAEETAFLVELLFKLEQEETSTVLMEHVIDCLCALDVADAVSVSVGTLEHGIVVRAMKGRYPEMLEAVRRRRITSAGEGGVLWASLQAMRSVWFDDYGDQPDASPVFVQSGLTAIGHVPFGRISGETGVLTAMRFTDRPVWSDREKALVETSARALTLSLARVERIEVMARAAVYTKAMMQVSRLTEQAFEPMEMAQHAIEIIARAVDVDVGGLTEVVGDSLRMRVVWSHDRVSPQLLRQVQAGGPRAESMAWQAMQADRALFVDDYGATPTPFAPSVAVGICAFAVVPLGGPAGEELAFVAIRSERARPWTEADRELFLAAARSVRLAVERRAHLDALEQAALTDPLTGLANRRALGRDLAAELSRAARHTQPLCVASLDLDGLKTVNDALGHAAGDLLIATFADLLRGCLRREDRMYRVGGDEFVLVLPHTNGAELTRDAVRARIDLAMTRVREVGFPSADVSTGLACYPGDGDSGDALLAVSDERMYAEKQLHRGRES